MSASRNVPLLCLKQLMTNEPEVLQHAVSVLLKCTGNILQNPDDPSMRKVSVADEDIQDFLLPAIGGIECLFEMGFVEDGEFFTLPASASLDAVKIVHRELKKHHHLETSNQDSASKEERVLPQAKIEPKIEPTLQEQEFYSKLVSSVRQVMNYLHRDALEKARLCIPLQQLREKAAQQLQQLGDKGCSVEDLLLIELLGWFKESFFKWMDSPSCSGCGGATVTAGRAAPLPEENVHLAHTVEVYRCQASCGQQTRFPRYNDPCRLLETRVGRCGEWANCFTLCCFAAGLEARLALDWTDHVWTEVYSTSQQRWLHADPCENACDRPLLYEAGWGKKLSYVIAFSPYDIQDVTWRYTAHPSDVLQRRTACRESWLASTIVALRNSIQQEQLKRKRLTAASLQIWTHRTAAELVELMCDNKSDTNNLGGRTTGSLEWRQARGELGSGTDVKSFVIQPTATEISSGVMELKYSCVFDEYIRISDNQSKTPGWQSLVFETKSVFRKKENDWKMVYLARQQGTEIGSVVWKIDLSSSGTSVDRLEIAVDSKCFENGKVQWTVCGGDQCAMINPGCLLVTKDFRGAAELVVKAALSGGVGDNAWQHTQLFRQSLSDTDSFPFHLRIHLRPDNKH